MATRQTTASKACTKCRIVKAASAFYAHPSFSRGLSSQCKACITETKFKFIKRDRHGRTVTADTYRMAKMKFGLTPEEYDALVDSSGACAVCCREFTGREPMIDHCHQTGRVRGLVCNRCNLMLGNCDDDPQLLMAAARYLEASQARVECSQG